jgi:hypothetical protein
MSCSKLHLLCNSPWVLEAAVQSRTSALEDEPRRMLSCPTFQELQCLPKSRITSNVRRGSTPQADVVQIEFEFEVKSVLEMEL